MGGVAEDVNVRNIFAGSLTYVLSTSWDARKVLMSASQTPHCSRSTCAGGKEGREGRKEQPGYYYYIPNRQQSLVLPSFLPFLPWEV